MDNRYLRFNEYEDFLSSLEHAAVTSRRISQAPSEWKWLIISLHNAWQGAMICTLSGSDGTGALTAKQQKEMRKWLEDSRRDPDAKPPEERAADPLELLMRCRHKKYMSQFGGQKITLSLEQHADARRLNALRREFVHFTPKGWSIEMEGLPRMVQSILAIIAQLIEHPANQHCLEVDQRERIKAAFGTIHAAVAL